MVGKNHNDSQILLNKLEKKIKDRDEKILQNKWMRKQHRSYSIFLIYIN